MRKNTTAMVFGILFGLGMIGLAYFNLVLALAISLAKKGDFFEYFIYIYPVLGVISIVGAALARKNIVATRIMLLIPNIVHIAVIVYTTMLGVLVSNIILFALYAVVAIFGLIALILAFTAKNKEDYLSPPPARV